MEIKKDCIRRSIKNKAFEEPKGVFIKSLLVMVLIISLINFGIICLVRDLGYDLKNELYNGFINLVTFIIVLPLYLNFIKMLLKNSHDDLIFFSDLFKIDKYSFKFLWYYGLIIFGYFIISSALNFIPYVGIIVNATLFLIFIPILFFVPYVFIENTNYTLNEMIGKSFKLVKNKKTEFYGLLFSFIPWLILGIVTFGILLLYVIPYVYIAFTYLYLNFKNEIKFPKKKILSDEVIISLFILGFIIVNVLYLFQTI